MKSLNLKKNISLSLVEFSLSTAFLFLGYKLLIMHEGISSVGLWSLLNSLTVLTKLGDIGFSNSIQKFLAVENNIKKNNKIYEIFLVGFFANLIIILLLCIIGYLIVYSLLGSFVEEGSITSAKKLLPFVYLSFFMLSMSNTVNNAISGLHLAYKKSYIMICGGLTQLLLVVILVPEHGLLGLIIANLVTYALTFIISLVVFFVSVKASIRRVNFNIDTLKDLFTYSIKLQFCTLANGLFEPIVKITISKFVGLSFLGIYEIAYKIVWLSRNFVVTGIMAISPAFSHLYNSNKKEMIDLYNVTKKRTALILLFGFILLLIISPLFSQLWFKEIKIDFIVILGVIAIGAFFSGVSSSAYILSISASFFRYNITLKILSTGLFLFIFSIINTFLYEKIFIVVLIAAIMSIESILIKILNEKKLLKVVQ